RGVDDHWTKRVRQYFAEDQARARGASNPRRIHKLTRAQTQEFATDETRDLRPAQHRDGDQDVENVRSEEGHEQHGKEEARNDLEDLREAHEQCVDAAAEEASK